jgi:hypothetical protein
VDLGLIDGTVGAIVVSGGTVAVERVHAHVRRRQAHGHIFALLGRRAPVHLVLPSVPVAEFPVRGLADDGATLVHQSPGNVLFMPMSEGTAVATIVQTLQAAGFKGGIHLVDSDRYEMADHPVITVGGPSVNAMTGQLLRRHAPTFSINYPGATEATHDSATYKVNLDSRGEVTGDYGFALITKQSNGAPVVALWGILAFGTAIAVKGYLNLKTVDPPAAKQVSNGEGRLLVFRGAVSGYVTHDVELVGSRRL